MAGGELRAARPTRLLDFVTTPGLTVVDPDSNMHLRGRFAPIREEIDAGELPVIGSIPTDLTGLFVRNGPNPEFPPLGSFTYPLEGDGMVHGVWLADGSARYRNRWVRTRGLRAEERAGRALYGGLLTPAFVDRSLLGEPTDPGWPFKLDAFINVVRHAGRLFALGEGVPPYALTSELDTLGPETFGGALAAGMCAHPRFDPDTGEMVYFRYDTRPPYLSWGALAADGSVSRPATPVEGVEGCHLVHDFALTPDHVVLVVAPALLDLDATVRGGPVLDWRPELGTRVGVIPRSGEGPTRWAHTDAFWAWHFANAYEVDEPRADEPRADGTSADGTASIVLDFPWWSRPGLTVGTESSRVDTVTNLRGSFTRATIRPAAGRVDLHHLNYSRSEFPRIDARRTTRRHRYVTVVGRSADDRLVRGEHDRLVRHDMVAGLSVSYEAGAAIGETVFAPRDGAREELDGYYLTFATSLSDPGAPPGAAEATSWLYIWDAGDFPTNPRARVQLPHRVPNGLHASWFPAPGMERRDRRVGERRTGERRVGDRRARPR
jgi:carotenoid cleavage dioxygenase